MELETPPGHVPEYAETYVSYTYDREPTIADAHECRIISGMGDDATVEIVALYVPDDEE